MLKYKNGILITLIAFILFLMTLWFVNADEETGNLEVDLNGYHIRLNFPIPTYVGENEFQVHLLDLDTTPLNNSKVTIIAAPILQTDENESSIEKKPMNMPGHYMLNVLQDDLPNSVLSQSPAASPKLSNSGQSFSARSSSIFCSNSGDSIGPIFNPRSSPFLAI